MTDPIAGRNARVLMRRIAGAVCLLALPGILSAATSYGRDSIIPKWGRFERSFKSTRAYTNPPREATLVVVFTSPLGDTRQVEGFWDGGKTWRVRFSPDQPGRWTYETMCTDWLNGGLNDQSGVFLCSAPIGLTRFELHGPVQIARDRRHFEHADRTPFFYLADAAWKGALASTPKAWAGYSGVRQVQEFTAVQWNAFPGPDRENEYAFLAGNPSCINPQYFKRLDAKVATLNHAGLLSVIAPFATVGGSTANDLDEADAILLLRYMVARWSAYDVAWLLGPPLNDGASAASERMVARWMRIGKEVIGAGPHAPVILFAGNSSATMREFRNQDWLDAFGYQSRQSMEGNLVNWLRSGALEEEWKQAPAHPLLNVAPPLEADSTAPGHEGVTAGQLRSVVYWSLLSTPSAGASYGAVDVAAWNTSIEEESAGARGSGRAAWERSLFLPGARQMATVVTNLAAGQFWRLLPGPELVADQPGSASPKRYIAAAFTKDKDLGLVYVPEDRTLKLRLEALPPSPVVSWINPRDGAKSPAVAVVSGSAGQFPTPAPGDWLLFIQAGK